MVTFFFLAGQNVAETKMNPNKKKQTAMSIPHFQEPEGWKPKIPAMIELPIKKTAYRITVALDSSILIRSPSWLDTPFPLTKANDSLSVAIT